MVEYCWSTFERCVLTRHQIKVLFFLHWLNEAWFTFELSFSDVLERFRFYCANMSWKYASMNMFLSNKRKYFRLRMNIWILFEVRQANSRNAKGLTRGLEPGGHVFWILLISFFQWWKIYSIFMRNLHTEVILPTDLQRKHILCWQSYRNSLSRLSFDSFCRLLVKR